MAWGMKSGKFPKLRWYEYLWAMLPIGLVTVGGAIGGVCGVVALTVNMKLMARPSGLLPRYGLTGLVTLVSVGFYVVLAKLFLAVTGLGAPTAAQVDRELQKTPIYATIAKAQPETYAKIRDTALEMAKQHRPQPEIEVALRAYLTEVTKHYAPIASDGAVVEMARVFVLETDEIGAKSADACFDYIFPRPGMAAVSITTLVDPLTLQRDAAATLSVLESGIADPQRVPAKAEVMQTLNRMVRQMVDKFGAADVGSLAKPASLDHARACSMMHALYADVLDLPPSEGVPLLRYFFAQSTAA